MQTKIEVTKTYWVGMTAEQKESLKEALITLFSDEPWQNNQFMDHFSEDEAKALSELRQALLIGGNNVSG